VTPKTEHHHFYSGRTLSVFFWNLTMLAGAGSSSGNSANGPAESSTASLLLSMVAGVGLLSGLATTGLKLFMTLDGGEGFLRLTIIGSWAVFALFLPLALWQTAVAINKAARK